MSTKIEIGPYSAYAIAVKYGYTGTEEEWIKEVERDRKKSEAAITETLTNAERAENAAKRAEELVGADKTLTVPGAPADAETVGKMLAAKLGLSGGVMSGNIQFASIGDVAQAAGLFWSGSTDGAGIYYQTTGSDQGNLVLNLTDDSNCYLRIAKNGVFKSCFSPDDGNFHGNVNGAATQLARSGNPAYPMTFNWAGQGGQPSWLWGGNDGTNMYVYNPSNFSVNYAGSAGSAGNGVVASGNGYVRFGDGTQICWDIYRGQTSGTSSVTREDTYEWPMPFVNTTYSVFIDAHGSNNLWVMERKTTYMKAYFLLGAGTMHDNDILAIGRWK